ncbi:cytochrome P450 3A6-like [Dermacentor albipictus]|uniref:cytochrome P450 3A6-like n=1 Tax=Dermacentor albipictus TaxID=60249 RepID=UPI0031FCF802
MAALLSVSCAFLLALALGASYGLVLWLLRERRKCFDAFRGTGVPTVPLRNIINGNSDEFWKQNVIKNMDQACQKYGDVFGFFLGDTPIMVVKDLAMINDIFIKDSSKFPGRGRMMHIYEMDPNVAKYIVVSKGSVWKSARTSMSKFFTTSKLKAVMPSLRHAQEEFIRVLGEHADRGIELDINSICERFTFDMISKAAYGMDTNVQRNPKYPLFTKALAFMPNIASGLFYNLGQNLYHWAWIPRILAKILGAMYANPISDMAKKIEEIIEYRRKNPQRNLPDMAQILLDGVLSRGDSSLKQHESMVDATAPLPRETLNELTSNCVAVFIGGYDTTRLALTYWFYLMGRHPDIQEKMRQEVLEAFKKEGDHLSLQTITTLPYTNQVISETMRLYPTSTTFTSRCAEEDYQCGNYLIKKGTSVVVPTYLLHRDPRYWHEPEKFVPERFSPENKHFVNPTAYQPFGLGPRICIGMRLALLELASATAEVLRHYRITMGTSQKHDLELDTCSFLIVPKESVRIHVQRLKGTK